MTRRVRSAFGRFLALSCASALTLLVVASSIAAQQTTGKLEGTVTDDKGAPIASAQVTIVGTSFGALTDNKGYYFVNNVPIGSYTVRAKFIGYTAAEVPGVRVQGGFTLTVNVKLTPSAVAIGPVTVEAAANPIVPRDKVTSGSTLAGDLVAKLPIDDVRQVLVFQPGVVESGAGRGVSIRGGRPGEANIYIDGAPVRSTNAGTSLVSVGRNALEEVAVTTGALGVEFSDAQSGVIAYTTKAGGEKLTGSFSTETDAPFGDAISVGYNRFEGSLGGPVPHVPRLSWFASGVLQGQLTHTTSSFLNGNLTHISGLPSKGADSVPLYVVGGIDTVVRSSAGGTVTNVVLPQFVQYSGQCGIYGSSASPLAQAIKDNYGYACQGRRRPMDWSTQLQLQGNLQYTYGNGSSVRLTGLATGNQERFYPNQAVTDPLLYLGAHTWSRLAVLNLNHQITRSSDRALAVNVNLSWGRDRGIIGPLDPTSEMATRDPALGLEFSSLDFAGLSGFPFPITDDIIKNIRVNSGLRTPLLDNTIDANNSQQAGGSALRTNPYGMTTGGWFTTGMRTTATLLSETRYIGRVVVDWQANRYHRFTLGGDAKKTDLSYFSSTLQNQIFMNAYNVHPVQFGLFAADRLDLGDVVLEVGGRWDYYNNKALFSNVPSFIQSSKDSVLVNGVWYRDWSPNAATNPAAYDSSLARTFTPGAGHHALSPRLRVSFPITDKTGFRLSYAHQVQTPEYTTLLRGINNDQSFTNTNDIFGRDLRFGKTILFEFGVRHAFSQDMVLDISAYNKDKVADFAARIVPIVKPGYYPAETTSVNILTNSDFGNTKGVDVKFDRRIGNYVNATASYTFQVATNTGSDPFTYLNTFARQVSALTGDRTLPPEQAQPTDDNRTHNFVGAVALSVPSDWKKGTAIGNVLRDLNAFITFYVRSGLYYTLLTNAGDGQTAPHLAFGLGGRAATDQLNTEVLPWTKNVDLRINKGFRVGRVDLTAYADIRNLFNFTNRVGVYAETGDVTNAKFKNLTILGPELNGLVQEATAAGVWSAADSSINLQGNCGSWGAPVNCEALRRVEARFGDGNGIYSIAEQHRALDTYYNSFFGPQRFNGEPRHIRVGVELNF